MIRRRPSLQPGLVVGLMLVAVTVQGLPAAADDNVVHVTASLVQVLAEDVDATGSIDTEAEAHEASDDLVSMVEVDGRLVALPDDVTVEGATGDEVVLTIEGSGRARGADAVAATVDEASPATVVEVEVIPGDVAPASAQNTLTILPVYWSGSPSITTTTLQTLATSTATYWSQQSGGSISTSVRVTSWIDARRASNVAVPTSCSYESMATLASQVIAAHGLSASGPNRVSVYFPYWNSCGWAGLGSVGGSYSWINGYTNPEILAHEYGHNLGLGHANWYDCGSVALTLPATSCTNREYGDTVDVMGSGTLTGQPGNLNAAMADWLGLAKVVEARPGTTTTVTLAPLGSVSSVRAVSIPVPGGTVYVGFRPHTSPDTRKPAWAGVQVHLRAMTSYYPTTYLLDMHPDQSFANPTLGAGETWQVPGSGLEVTVTAVNGTSSAKVTVRPTVIAADAAGSPFAADIAWLVDQGITTGHPDGTFRPAEDVSRQAMAAFLYRAAGSPSFTAPTVSPFMDAAKADPFYKEIAWLAAAGVSTGTDLGRGRFAFQPGDPVSRQAMAAFLYRAAGSPSFTAPTVSPFADVSTSGPFYKEIAWLAATGISTGTDLGRGRFAFQPGDPVSRQAMAAFLHRASTV